MRRLPLSIDQARLLPHLRLAYKSEVLEASATTADVDTPAPRSKVHKPEPADLRGIPVVGPAVSGVSPGTDPLEAVLAKERRAGRTRSPRTFM
jgi:hypothetical protein